MCIRDRVECGQEGNFSCSHFYQPHTQRLWRETSVSFAALRARLVSRVVVRSGSMDVSERVQMTLASIGRLLADGSSLEELGVEMHGLVNWSTSTRPNSSKALPALSLRARLLAIVLQDAARSVYAELNSIATALEALPSSTHKQPPQQLASLSASRTLTSLAQAQTPVAPRGPSVPRSPFPVPTPAGGRAADRLLALIPNFDDVDDNNDGVISFSEFKKAVGKGVIQPSPSYRDRIDELVGQGSPHEPQSAHPCVLCSGPVRDHNCAACCGVFCQQCCVGTS
eukprot:TRINITY_DN19574_c0_g1_i3.p1 TRINITY_DN19574_c0_g1~~TRINITY_DN19574_c0_g1_i3.p1  ORF type:complete len:283 (+),score=43.62 TRINITY_DN19574_c0_g1_i3:151-999(+)